MSFHNTPHSHYRHRLQDINSEYNSNNPAGITSNILLQPDTDHYNLSPSQHGHHHQYHYQHELPPPHPYHIHNKIYHFRPHLQAPLQYGVITGKVLRRTEHCITGKCGDHLQFFLDIGNSQHYQVDVNIKSRDGKEIQVYFADEDLPQLDEQQSQCINSSIQHSFGFSSAQISYKGLGLSENHFRQVNEDYLISKLEAELNGCELLEIYGITFHDGRLHGIHNIHYQPNDLLQDGAIALYDYGNRVRTWAFFKFMEDSIN